MDITAKSLKEFRDEFSKVMLSLEETFEITISVGNIRYNTNEFNLKIVAINGDKAEVEHREFEQHVLRFAHLGLKKEMYRQEFIARDGKTYILVALKPKARKNMCVIREKMTGKEYCSGPGFLGI